MKNIAINSDVYGRHLVLPPTNELVNNGHFEDGLLGWEASGPVTPTIITDAGHTGDFALKMEMLDSNPPPLSPSKSSINAFNDLLTTGQLSQSILTPLTDDDPTLSWFYAISGTTSLDGRLLVTVQGKGNATHSITATLPLTTTQWTHQWMPLDSLAGQTVMIIFELQHTTPAPSIVVLLDEISLGEGNKEPDVIFLPIINKNR